MSSGLGGDFWLLCKSHGADLRRFQRLLASVQRFNRDRLPLAVVVPEVDRPAFEAACQGTDARVLTDEAVVQAHPRAEARGLLERYRATTGYLSQQVVKSEAWRVLGCAGYLCVDSDTRFIRPFGRGDFMDAAGRLFTVIGQDADTFALAAARGHTDMLQQVLRNAQLVQAEFGRQGPAYVYGPLPVIWSARVWQGLDADWLAPRGQTLWDAIDRHPHEARWYGEYLLHSEAIPLLPIGPLARCHHHAWMRDAWAGLGETDASLATVYLAVVEQSNWDESLDMAPRRSRLSAWARQIKRLWRKP